MFQGSQGMHYIIFMDKMIVRAERQSGMDGRTEKNFGVNV